MPGEIGDDGPEYEVNIKGTTALHSQISEREKDLRRVLIVEAPLEKIIHDPDTFDDFCMIIERWGWIQTKETDKGVLYRHPIDPERYKKLIPYSLFKEQ